MNLGDHVKSNNMQVVAQWITSLAVSIICCAILFIIFAGYIVQIHDQASLLSVKIDIVQERNAMLMNEIAALRKGPLVQINTSNPANVQVTPQENAVMAPDGQPQLQPAQPQPAGAVGAAPSLPAATATPPSNVGVAPPPQPVPTPEKTDIVLPAEELAPEDVIVPDAKVDPKKEAPKAKPKAKEVKGGKDDQDE